MEVNENPAQEAETPEGENESTITTLEEALKELKKVRTEAASRRVKGKEAEEKAKLWEDHVNSQKSELERLTDENTKLRKDVDDEKVKTLKATIVAEFGLSKEDAELLTGSEKEMKALAARLANASGNAGGKPDFYAGQRGKGPAPKPANLNEWFNQLWKETEENSTKRKFTSS